MFWVAIFKRNWLLFETSRFSLFLTPYLSHFEVTWFISSNWKGNFIVNLKRTIVRYPWKIGSYQCYRSYRPVFYIDQNAITDKKVKKKLSFIFDIFLGHMFISPLGCTIVNSFLFEWETFVKLFGLTLFATILQKVSYVKVWQLGSNFEFNLLRISFQGY